MQEVQEMFKNTNKVTRPEKALILGFMAGSRALTPSHYIFTITQYTIVGINQLIICVCLLYSPCLYLDMRCHDNLITPFPNIQNS